MASSKKKYALCLFGLPPMACNKNVKNVKKDLSHILWKKNVIDRNDIDVFMHVWGEDDSERLQEKFEPIKFMNEKQIVFHSQDDPRLMMWGDSYPEDYNCTAINMFYSQAYSAKKSIEMKKLWEKEKGFKYDAVMISRIDCLWFTPVDFNQFRPSRFYISSWNQERSLWGPNGCKLPSRSNKTTIKRKYKKILDYWFVSSSKNIDAFGELYDYVSQWLSEQTIDEKLSNHSLKKDFLEHIGLWENVRFKFYVHTDHTIQRHFYFFKDYKKPRFKNIAKLLND
tara:strand:- start:672 stop:1517 length:846 start_codon:yes stop_codon:yes gene_type:complete